METLAGLPPIRFHIQKLFHRAALRNHTLMDTHPMRALITQRNLNPLIPYTAPLTLKYPLDRCKARAPPTPINSAAPFASTCTEVFKFDHVEAQPGKRLVDTFAERITKQTDHPKKGSDQWEPWLEGLRT